ncbi:glycoside hydrolase family 3 protein [Andreprevotia chitinilytica]|uniref:glycoside hydrolase family 3 protein n=1 Tax=Andreprevotia chitinilytica TaxID=396808 RepID=UPI000A02E0E3|nr:exo 1,3/1,4-beta-D-glucan glucohydrolase [Andreprevotia chitinilytica]
MGNNCKPWLLAAAFAAAAATSLADEDGFKPLAETRDWPRIEHKSPHDRMVNWKVEALLRQMSLEEKVGQMTQVEIQNVTPDEVRKYHLGSVLNGGGSWPGQNKAAKVQDWLNLADSLWAASVDPSNPHRIPLIWGTDAVHGHNNVRGATLYPHNIGLGAARDPRLLHRIGEAVAQEVAATGIDWAFGPTLAVVRDDRWGRTYEGYSEYPVITEAYAEEVIEGLQGRLGRDPSKVIATAKHFIGDGGTTNGTDQGVTVATEETLRNLHARGYYGALRADVQTVMASFSSWQDQNAGATAKAYKMHGNKYLLTDVLKNKLGFDGFVISDWNGIGQVNRSNSDSPTDCSNSDCPWAINAGIDMVMVPDRTDWQAFIANTIAEVKNGTIPQARIDDAVRRILRVKFNAGLFEKPTPSARLAVHEVGTPEHRELAREAVRKSLVLLKNNGGTLPLRRDAKVLVAGKSADNLSNQAGGWSVTWQGSGLTNDDFPGATSVWKAVQQIAPQAVLDTSSDGALADASFDAAVVVIGETPYAEGVGDIGKTKTLELARLHPEDVKLIESLRSRGVKKIVTVLFSGRPLYASRELNRSDAFVAAWLPGSEGEGIADVLFRRKSGAVNVDFAGKLSYSWPKSACQTPLNVGDADYAPLYAYGYGLNYRHPAEQGQYDETSRDYGCGMDGSGGGSASTPLTIYDRGNQNGWVMRIGAPSNWGGIDVAQASASTTATPAGEISATPVDDQNGIQWAAVKVHWNNAAGQVYMQSATSLGTDLSPYLNAHGSLVFDAKLATPASSAVTARIDCGYPCIGAVDVTTAVNALPVNSWTSVAIPLSCFATAGTDFTNVNTPLLLYTSGAFDISLANIRWDPTNPGTVSCP